MVSFGIVCFVRREMRHSFMVLLSETDHENRYKKAYRLWPELQNGS